MSGLSSETKGSEERGKSNALQIGLGLAHYSEAEKDDYWETLDAVIAPLRAKYILILLGDLNARILTRAQRTETAKHTHTDPNYPAREE